MITFCHNCHTDYTGELDAGCEYCSICNDLSEYICTEEILNIARCGPIIQCPTCEEITLIKYMNFNCDSCDEISMELQDTIHSLFEYVNSKFINYIANFSNKQINDCDRIHDILQELKKLNIVALAESAIELDNKSEATNIFSELLKLFADVN